LGNWQQCGWIVVTLVAFAGVPAGADTVGTPGVIFVNGPLATGVTSQSGATSPAGTEWSEVAHDTGSTTAANTLSGLGCQAIVPATNNRCADDFTVPVGGTFEVEKVRVYAYQTGFAGPNSPVVDASVQIWNGVPGDAGAVVVAGNPSSLPFTSSDVSLFRIFHSGPPLNTPPGTTRRIWEVTLSLPTPAVLPAGTYWIDFQINAGASGNFTPIVTVPGFRTIAGWNARQFTGAWAEAFDDGTPVSEPDVALDLPFELEGLNSVIFVDGFNDESTAAWSVVFP
jgi:hypothetical protein